MSGELPTVSMLNYSCAWLQYFVVDVEAWRFVHREYTLIGGCGKKWKWDYFQDDHVFWHHMGIALFLVLRACGAGWNTSTLTICQIRIFPTPPKKDYCLTTNISVFLYLRVLSTVKFQSSTKKVYHFDREIFHTRLTKNNTLRRFDSNKPQINILKLAARVILSQLRYASCARSP